MDMADEYDIGTYFSKVFRIDGGLGVIDFSMLRLKENHETKPLWVCPNFRIFLDVSRDSMRKYRFMYAVMARQRTF